MKVKGSEVAAAPTWASGLGILRVIAPPARGLSSPSPGSCISGDAQSIVNSGACTCPLPVCDSHRVLLAHLFFLLWNAVLPFCVNALWGWS